MVMLLAVINAAFIHITMPSVFNAVCAGRVKQFHKSETCGLGINQPTHH